MKKIFLTLTALLTVVLLCNATDLTGKRIYVNPGHGSYGPNDRPMATISYPNLSSTGMPDTCGFYESNTNLWKCLFLRDKLVAAGATVVMSREACGPWPYQKVNGQYPDYSWTDYQNRSDYTMYNKNLSEICEEVESGNYDLFLSVHSNALTEGSTTNYPLYLYRGYDAASSEYEQTSKAIGAAMWPWRWEMFEEGYDQKTSFSKTSMNLRGDVSFQGSGSTSTRSNGKSYYGYYGVLKHGCVGGLYEGYFHTYQPARHRALNHDHCKMEGLGYYRGIIDYFHADPETKGYILGFVKDEHEKISHPLFTYAPKTPDQWLPCNGAVVTLYKGGVKVADYTVDNNYNGVFYFGNLEPGDDYTLDATCEGYNPLYDQYKQPITVTANHTTYPRIYLESDSYTPPAVVYETYPEPDMPAYMGLAGKYNMTETFADQLIPELAGKTIRRSIVRDNNTMYVLALDNSNEPYLYLINPSTHTLTATLPTDFCTVSASGKLKLSDIAVTADGVLIGCNEEAVTFTPSNNWLVYKWTNNGGVWSGAMWINTTTNETSGNYYNAVAGSTLAYAGSLSDGYIYSTTYTTGSDAHGVRYFVYTVADGVYAGAFRNQDGTHKLSEMGHDIQFTISPEADNKVIITASNIAPMEWTTVTTTASAPVIKKFPAAFSGTKGMTFFKYAKHRLMVVPAADKACGVAMYDITEGVDNPKEVNLAVAGVTAEATATTATAVVANGDINLFAAGDTTLTKYTTAEVTQPVVPHINAYNLGLTYDEESHNYTFTYTTNIAANATNIVFYQKGEEVGKVAVAPAAAGENSAVINQSDLPGFTGTPTNWAVELVADNVANWAQLHADNSMLNSNTTRVFNAVDKSPESPFFGRIYIMRRSGSSTSEYRPTSGIYAYNQDYTKINDEYLKGGCEFGNPARLSVAPDGFVYQADWADGYSGVYVIDPANLNGSFTQFFQGTRAGSGLFTNNGVQVGSSTPGLNIYGTGKDTKLIVYNEDAGGTLPANGIAVYNIGQPDGTIAHSWGEAPSAVYPLTMQGNTEGTPIGTSHGIFVSQHRSSGNNNTAAPSLLFIDYNGTMQMATCYEPYNEIIEGSDGGGYAVSPDEKTLVLQGGRKQFYVFDITWEGNKPVLKLRYEYTHGIQTIRQINFDFAGNLVCSGESGLNIFTMPTYNNVTVVPAKSTLTVEKPFSGNVEGVLLDKKEAALEKDATLTLTATVMPEQATEKGVTWSSNNEAVATVADGVVTAVASGNAVITVTTTEGSFTATCNITVITPVTGVTLDKETESLFVGETATLTATVAPADADDKNITWTSSDAKVATVANGVVTAVGAGSATITVKTVDGGFTATCTVTVAKAPVPVTGVTLDKATLEMKEGETAVLVATVAPADADDSSVTWTTSDANVATVADGTVTAVAEGTATITVTTTDGEFTATCEVSVTRLIDALDNISLNGVYYVDGTLYNEQGRRLYLFTAAGRLVLTSEAQTISLNGMPQGTYVVRIADSSIALKIVK